MSNTDSIKNSTLFLNWQTLFTTLNYFISVPKINIFNKQLIANALGVTVGSLISNLIRLNEPQLINRLEKRVKKKDIVRFIEYFKAPNIDALNKELLDIIICPDNDYTLPFALLELTFEALADVVNLEAWSIIDYEKDSIDYDYITENITQHNILRNVKEGDIDTILFNELMMQVFTEELIRFSTEKMELSLLMPYLHRPRYNKLMHVEKNETSDKIVLSITSQSPSIAHHWIEQIYPFGDSSIKNLIIRPHIEEFNSNLRNEAYMKHFPDKNYKTFELKLGYFINNMTVLTNSLIIMASDISKIKIDSTQADKITITIKK